MSTSINLNTIPFSYSKDTKTFTISEKDVKFATTYAVTTPKGTEAKEFEFTHSTGPEFDPNTKWIYKSEDGYLLEVCNDAKTVKVAAAAYLAAKLRH